MNPSGQIGLGRSTDKEFRLAPLAFDGVVRLDLSNHWRASRRSGCSAFLALARPFGLPDGFIAAGLYCLLIGLALLGPQISWVRYSIRAVALVAGLANILGAVDMARFGAYCFYCLLTTVLTPFLVWAAFLI